MECTEDLVKIQVIHPLSYCYQFDPNQPTASYKQAMKKWVL